MENSVKNKKKHVLDDVNSNNNNEQEDDYMIFKKHNDYFTKIIKLIPHELYKHTSTEGYQNDDNNDNDEEVITNKYYQVLYFQIYTITYTSIINLSISSL